MRNRLLTGAAGLSLLLAACSGAEAEVTTEAPAAATDQAAPAVEQPATIDVLAGNSSLGDVLVGPDGRTLYGFTNDVAAASTCYGTCVDAWPPVIVPVDWTAGPGLDFGIFATTVREDGQLQLVAGQWPLYYFAGDAAPGDIEGQGSGDVWFAVDLGGRLITAEGDTADPATEDTDGAAVADEASDTGSEGTAPVVSAETELGTTLVDGEGLTLYGFLKDADGNPTCNDACADAWPPLVVDGAEVPAGLDPDVFSVVTRDDGSFQLKAGKWPLYFFAGDAGPGDVNGQGSGDVWFAAAPDGSLIGAGGAMEETSIDTGTDTETDAGSEPAEDTTSDDGY